MTVANRYHTIAISTFRCVNCGLVYGLPEGFIDQRRKDGNRFYCPNGHGMSYTPGPTEADKLRKQLADAEAEKKQLEIDAAFAYTGWNESDELLKKAQKEAKRVEKRIHAGVCPCCNRTFQNVARHMATKHKEQAK